MSYPTREPHVNTVDSQKRKLWAHIGSEQGVGILTRGDGPKSRPGTSPIHGLIEGPLGAGA